MNTLIEINRILQKSQQYQEKKLIQHTLEFVIYKLEDNDVFILLSLLVRKSE